MIDEIERAERDELIPVDPHMRRSFNPQANFVPANVDYRDADRVADADSFLRLPGEYEHVSFPP
jgi:hypothetical protein